MKPAWLKLRVHAGLLAALAAAFCTPSALASSKGCTAINDLSGATSLSFSSNRYPASDFLPGDALTLSFTDAGSAYGAPAMNADSISLARHDFTYAQTYNAANSSRSTAHSLTISIAAGSLEAYGLAVRATTTHGQISNLVFNCQSQVAEPVNQDTR